MPDRFIFRQVQADDLAMFLADSEVRAKNHHNPQRCHQVSYQEIIDRRGTDEFPMPLGGVVNDYVPFYFSPKTSFSYTIHMGNVPLHSPQGERLGQSSDSRRIFLVCKVGDVAQAGVGYCFSDFPLNSMAPQPSVITDIRLLETHVHWDVFDESPISGMIDEIGYGGVCSFFKNMDTPPSRQLRSQKRMAEFLVKNALPLELVTCIVVKTIELKEELQTVMDASQWHIPIYAKPGCYF